MKYDAQAQLRQMHKQYWKEVQRIVDLNEKLEAEYYAAQCLDHKTFTARGYRRFEPIPLPTYPQDFLELTCGAKTKSKGTPCKQKVLYSNGRCKFHGGMSTGPRTVEGKRRSALNGFCLQK